MTTRIAVAVEATPKRTFAIAIDWPGWARSGKTLPAALEALAAHAPRYARVAALAGEAFSADELGLEVYESDDGGAGTEFGVPSRITGADRRATSEADGERLARLVDASWQTLAAIASTAPESLRKGPRGGGRDRTKMLQHVLEAEHAYAREMGVRVPAPDPGDARAVAAMHRAMLDVLREPSDGSPLADRRWTVRYAAHRIAWHTLDHAWEIEDRSEPTG